MPDLKELTTKQMETKETVKRFSAACTALQNGSNPISTTMFRKLPALCYMILVFGLDVIVRLCKCEQVIPKTLTDAQRENVLERCIGLPKEKVNELQQLIHCNPQLLETLGWDEGNLCCNPPAIYKF